MIGVALFKDLKAEEVIKLVLALVLVLLIGLVSWGIYSAGYDKAEKKFGVYKEQYDKLYADHQTWVKESKEAQVKYERETREQNRLIEEQLQELFEQAKKKPITIEKVIEYVPEEVDHGYHLPTGLVRLYRDTLVETPSTDSPTFLPRGLAFDVGAPSELAVSQFGLIAAQNNAECVVRGAVIKQWQNWYHFHKDRFDELTRKKADSIPVVQ